MDSAVLLDAVVVTRCRRRVHLDHDPAAVDEPRAGLDATAQRRIADAVAHRRWVADRLAEHHTADWAALRARAQSDSLAGATRDSAAHADSLKRSEPI